MPNWTIFSCNGIATPFFETLIFTDLKKEKGKRKEREKEKTSRKSKRKKNISRFSFPRNHHSSPAVVSENKTRGTEIVRLPCVRVESRASVWCVEAERVWKAAREKAGEKLKRGWKIHTIQCGEQRGRRKRKPPPFLFRLVFIRQIETRVRNIVSPRFYFFSFFFLDRPPRRGHRKKKSRMENITKRGKIGENDRTFRILRASTRVLQRLVEV